MATALPLPPDNLSSMGLDSYTRRLSVADVEFQDTRYPTVSSSSSKHRPTFSERQLENPRTDASRASWVDFAAPTTNRLSGFEQAWVAGKLADEPSHQLQAKYQRPQDADQYQAVESRLPDGAGVPRSSSSGSPYLPPDEHRLPSNNVSGAQEQALATFETGSPLQNPDMGQRISGLDQYRGDQYVSSSPKHPSLPPPTGVSASTSGTAPPIVPMSAGPSYSSAAMAIPISPKPRAHAQQPTYITPSSAPNPINPVYAQQQALPKEEICIECAMRDQDMADVDVTSPGVWRRDSDADYEELLQRELEERTTGIPQSENSSRPRARGMKLTQEHLKLWLSIVRYMSDIYLLSSDQFFKNPKEPSSRQQTLDQYVKSQRALLEAEALAHARAMRESRQLDDKMRDAYSQLRRSAYELGSAAQPTDDSGGVRIKAPRSVSTPNALQSHGREVTLLENGMIVEHVDVRKEEREERERRKREEKRERSRVRKTSRTSRGDAMSVYSVQTPLPTDSGFFSGVRNDSRYSQSISQRPSSILTAGGERPPTLLRAQSQASFSDMQSVGSGASPRRSRFFGLRNLSPSGWRSQESVAPSGSMIDMQYVSLSELICAALTKQLSSVALQREAQLASQYPSPDVVDIGSNAPTLRLGESWPRMDTKPEAPAPTQARSNKKTRGLKKIWKLVTGSSSKSDSQHNIRSQSRSLDRTEDDAPLAPPPPLSYLVSQGGSARRHGSTTSLPSTISPNALSPYTTSPPTAPSSLQPSPTSSRRSADKERADLRNGVDQEDDAAMVDSDLRGRTPQSSWTLSSTTGPTTPPMPSSPRPMSASMRRDKSLPPLPGESSVEFPSHPMPEGRPQTLYTYDPRSGYPGLSPPQAPFRTSETRRQSFGGVGSKPLSQTLPVKGALARGQLNVPPFLAEEKYGEFGASRISIGQWPGAEASRGSLPSAGDKPKKRKSKFGLSALFGKKSNGDQKDVAVDPLDFSVFRMSPAGDSRDPNVVAGSGYASPVSASSHAQRMSVMSRKNIGELVDQDSEFIAYRYPSNDQRLDLLR